MSIRVPVGVAKDKDGDVQLLDGYGDGYALHVGPAERLAVYLADPNNLGVFETPWVRAEWVDDPVTPFARFGVGPNVYLMGVATANALAGMIVDCIYGE